MKHFQIAVGLAALATIACAGPGSQSRPRSEWKKILSAAQFHILFEAGTDPAFDSPYHDNHADGIYYSVATGAPLFSSKHKFDSGTGWPSFYQPIKPGILQLKSDSSYGMVRVEVLEAASGGHLGHVFDDGPAPTGKRYCMNGTALKFVAAKLDRNGLPVGGFAKVLPGGKVVK